MSDVADFTRGEPPPLPGGGPSIHDLVVEEIISRRNFGYRKYGSLLQAWNGRRPSKDLLDEILDAAMYVRQLIQEEDGLMLSVAITKDGEKVGKLVVVKLDESLGGELADYKVEMLVERGDGVVAVHRRVLESFPRKSVNSIGLLKAALNLFDSESLGLEDDFDSDTPLRDEAGSSDMERRLETVVRHLQKRAS